MDIKVEFDDEQSVWFKNGEGTLFFEVTWEDNGIHYPMENWSDFGDVILGWWGTTIVQLLEGSDEGEFLFMDGPYSVKAKYNRRTGIVELIPKGRDTVWRMPIIDLLKKLVQALDKASGELVRRTSGEEKRAALAKSSAVLRRYL